jgi:AcrR family transcriptional regulator
MELKLNIKLNEKLFLRDPDSTELGRRIIRHSITMIHDLGIESFTFKKLAEDINTTEASIYRYFENKYRLLQYIVTWYWTFMEYLVLFHVNNLEDKEAKVLKIIELLVGAPDYSLGAADFDTKSLYEIVIRESTKVYLNKSVDDDNSVQLFKPYKDLCARIAGLISEYNPTYPYPRSLSSTLVETAHFQHFFMQHLPRLTDFQGQNDKELVKGFLQNLVFSAIRKD